MDKAQSEYDLLIKFNADKAKLQQLKDATTEAQKEFDETERQLIERLQDEGKNSTARYEGIGYIGVNSPVVYASYTAENKDSLFKFLRSRKRQDLIQRTVNSRSLSSYIKELLDAGKKVPECVSYYLKVSARFYAEKK